ncbi:hypothetical protein [Bacillus toyonensis]|uniref:hypothetical protein n=1 Tax=Bacillus toyonensis TaxID=155322 RepID=UPI000BF830A1|nr:hypothetical protein [Bacillus toyonensis]PGF05131.1 hypothetical protein COM61_01530 [Bacillus toyonensis]
MSTDNTLQVAEGKANVLKLYVTENVDLKWEVIQLETNEEGFIEHETIVKAINGGEYVGGMCALETSSLYYDEEGINNFETWFAIKTPYEYTTKVYGVGVFVGHGIDEEPIGLTEEEIKEMRERCEIRGYGSKQN